MLKLMKQWERLGVDFTIRLCGRDRELLFFFKNSISVLNLCADAMIGSVR